jgi:hypothetical protein
LNHSAKVNLANRLICSFRLLNGTNSGFWQGTPYVPLSETALFPERDELRDEFRKVGLSEA